MNPKIPSQWLPYVRHFPILQEALHWEPLRQWSLSDVWRVTLSSGQTLIAKLGNESMAGELEIYKSVLQPLDLPRPSLYASFQESALNVFLMEDLGQTTVEMHPTVPNLAGAAQTLASMRRKALQNVGLLSPSVYNAYFRSQENVIEDFDVVINSRSLYLDDELALLQSCLKTLPKHLSELYKKYPVTLTHNDYNGKNLMVVNGGVVPIDWSNAYLSPHLGDLYCLIREAQGSAVDKSVVIDAYRDGNDVNNLDWQVQVGGICWLIRGLRWVCEEGIHKVPGTHSWISPMIAELGECLGKI